MASAPLLVLLVAVSPAIERAVDVVTCGVELARATAARVLDAPALQLKAAEDEEDLDSADTDARRTGTAHAIARAPRAARVHTASLVPPVLQHATRPLPRPPVSEPGAARGPPVRGA